MNDILIDNDLKSKLLTQSFINFKQIYLRKNNKKQIITVKIKLFNLLFANQQYTNLVKQKFFINKTKLLNKNPSKQLKYILQ